MTDDDLKMYLIETEKRYELMEEKYLAAVQLIGRLFDPEMSEDVFSYRDQIAPWLEERKIEYHTHAGWCVGVLCESPEPETQSGWHYEMIQAARNYYQALDSGKDPGPAKKYLNVMCYPTGSPEILAQKWEAFEQMIPMLEMSRLMKGYHDED